MVVHAHGMKHVDLRYLRDKWRATSIWTVDLAHMIRHFGLRVHFLTTTLGANPAYANEKFYKENIEDDGDRVRRLFSNAVEAGIDVSQRSISLRDLCAFTSSGEYLVILLVDKRKLQGSGGGNFLAHCCGGTDNVDGDYIGHYILLYGYDASSREFLVRDPAASSGGGKARIKDKLIEQARKSFGTDEDILLVSSSRDATKE
mmetsp:Transcript_10377/g.26337  ORF Transcript_10377/g.26337 Transcript_10377/m.26337 type:complete len:202 (-) Transcript_10377:1308-1913(-)